LIHVHFLGHGLHLLQLLLQRLLIDLYHISLLDPRLSLHNISQLLDVLLLGLDQHLLILDFLILGDEPFLESMYLRHELVGLRIRCFQFAPSMHIDRVLDFLT